MVIKEILCSVILNVLGGGTETEHTQTTSGRFEALCGLFDSGQYLE